MSTTTPEIIGEPIAIGSLYLLLGWLDDALIMRLGADGKTRLAHRMTPAHVVALLDLTEEHPRLEQIAQYPSMFKDDVSSAWDEIEVYLDPAEDVLWAERGPLLITEIESGAEVDIYCDAPPWEDGAVPTRTITSEDARGGWFVDRLCVAFARKRVRIRARHSPYRHLD
jgi:hypothetical protein